MTNNFNVGKTYRIIDIDITQSITDRGISAPEIIGLVAGLYNNHATMGNPVMFFTPRHLGFSPDAITIVGIFDTDDQVVKTCICRFSELKDGSPSTLGDPQLLYPHDIKISKTINFPSLIEYFWKSL